MLNGTGDLPVKNTEKAKLLSATIFLVSLVGPAFRGHRSSETRGARSKKMYLA